MGDKEKSEERDMHISPSWMPAEVNKLYITLWLSNNKPAISCRLQVFDIRMTQHSYREPRSPLHSCTRASLKNSWEITVVFKVSFFPVIFWVIAVTFLWLFQQWDTAAWGWLWLHSSYKTVSRLLLWEFLIPSPFPPNLWYLAILK